MATYTNGITDYIPALQPFNPDLNFYAGVLSTKQQQYDQGLSKLNSIYSSALNSPMLRQDNIERRDQYFKTITQDVQKIAGLDLSVDQNVETAKRLFDPILNDKNIVNDMVFTRKLSDSYNTAEQYRNCIDPDKCGGEFWNEGVQALDYAVEEFKNASPDDALRHSAPKFVPKINVTKKAIKAAKDAGFNISTQYVQNGYDITDENGYLLLGQVDKEGNKISDGILPQFLYGVFGNDNSVQEMYKTQAFVQRKSAAKQIAAERGIDESQAESIYLDNILSKAIPRINKAKNDLSSQRATLNSNSSSLEEVAKDKGGIFPGDGIGEAYEKIQDLLQKTDASEAYHDNNSNIINTAPNLSDLRALRNRVDGIVANANFMNTIDAAAAEYAMGTAKHKMEENKYSLASFNNQLDINKAKALKEYDHLIWKEQQSLLGNIGSGTGKTGKQGYANEVLVQMEAKGIGWDDVAEDGITPQNFTKPESLAKLAKKGITVSEDAQLVPTFLSVGSDLWQNTYLENSKITGEATQQAEAMTNAYLHDTFKSWQTAYRNALSNPDKKKGQIIMDQIMSDAKSTLTGTGYSAERLLSGNDTPRGLMEHLESFGHTGKVNNVLKTLQQSSPASRVYNAGWSTDQMLAMETAQQSAHKLLQAREETQRASSDNILAGYKQQFVNGDLSKEEYTKKVILFNSIYDEKGNLRPAEVQKDLYKKHTGELYAQKSISKDLINNPTKYLSTIVTGTGFESILSNIGEEAGKDFLRNAPSVITSYNSNLKAINAKRGSVDEGGAIGPEKSAVFSVKGDQPYASAFVGLKNIAKDVLQLPADKVQFSSVVTDPDKIDVSQDVVGKGFLNDISVGNTKNLNFTYQIQDVPNRYSGEMFEGINLPSLWKNDLQQKNEALATSGELPGKMKEGFVAVKVTINNDDKIREYKGLKRTDPITDADRTFIMTLPNSAKSLGSIQQRISKSPADIYLQTDGAELNYNLGNNMGGFTLRNGNTGLEVVPSVYELNDRTGKVVLKTLPVRYLKDMPVEAAVKTAASIVQEYNAIDAEQRKDYLLKQELLSKYQDGQTR